MSKAKAAQLVLRKLFKEVDEVEAGRQAVFKKGQQARVLGKMGLTPEKYDKLIGSEKVKVARRMMDETPKDWTLPPENMIKPPKYQRDNSPEAGRKVNEVRRRLKGRGSSRRV